MLRTTRRRISVWALAALVLCGALAAQGDSTAAHAQRRGRGGYGGGSTFGGGDSRLVGRAEQVTGDRFRIETATPRGVRVYAITPPSAQMLRAIDNGLGDLFAVARRRGYRARLNYSDYTVFIARPDRARDSSGAYSPDIAVGSAQYAGSVYDQGGYVFAAGMVLAFQPMAFIIADHDRDFARVSNVARYEGEHLVLYHNDQSLYQRTLDHSRGGGHPILQ